MKLKLFTVICPIVFLLIACGESNDYRDVYVGDYTGSGYSGSIVVVGTGVSRDIASGNGIITVGKDKSSVHMLTIKIDDGFGPYTYSAHIEGSGLSIDQVEFDLTGDDSDYTYQVYKTGTGTITPTTISLQFQYSGTAKYDPDPNDPSRIRYYEIVGSGMCSGTK